MTLPTPAAPTAPAGTTIAGRYTVRSVLGRGGFSTVYLCATPEGGAVAVKVLHPHLTRDARVRARFRLEARVLSHLDGPRITRVHDFGCDRAAGCFMAMDYVDAPDLSRWLRECGALNLREAIVIAEHVLEALDGVHRRGLCHRDVKPSNVLLRWDGTPGGTPSAVLTDFGIVKVIDATLSPIGMPKMTAPGEVFCTPLYAAPEVFAGLPQRASDVFSLGMLIAELLDGALPDARLGHRELRRSRCRLEEVVLGPRAQASRLGGWLRRCTEVHPARRLPDAQAARVALREVVAGIPPADIDAPPIWYGPEATAPTTAIHEVRPVAWETQDGAEPAESVCASVQSLVAIGGSPRELVALIEALAAAPGPIA